MKAKNWALPAIGAALFTFSMVHVVRGQKTHDHPAPLVAPATTNGEHIAGTGVIEPSSENVSVGSHRSGIVTSVFAKAGAFVHQGDSLFCLDDRAAVSDVHAREADLKMAQSQLARLLRMPRPELLPPLEAKVAEAKAKLDDAEDDLQRTEQLVKTGALPEEQRVRAFERREAAASVQKAAQSQLDLERAGSWAPDRTVAAASIDQARANLERAKTELDLLCAHAQVDATILRVDVHPGEFVTAGPGASLVTLGVTQPLFVRVDLDEVEIPRFQPNGPAKAFVRGSSESIELRFVRVEPFVQPKKSLSGASTERLDTRVLQVIYEIVVPPSSAFVGEQVDVTLEVSKKTETASISSK